MHCTGWPVCTLRILWHSDGSCRGIPPRHLNSDIQQPAVSSQPTMEPFYTRGHFLCAGDLDTDSGGQILNAGQVAGRLGRKNTRTTSLYCIDSSILQYKMWFVCITALLINNPWLQWYHCQAVIVCCNSSTVAGSSSAVDMTKCETIPVNRINQIWMSPAASTQPQQ